MSDIDFDELDRAVNGALGTTPVAKPVDTPEPVKEAPVTNEPVPAVEESVPVTVTQAQSSTPTTPAARRSAGRFMDMVHPSSDMRSKINGATSSAPIVASTPEPVVEEAKEETGWNEPLESPFLPDTKVEKRPLGGSAPAAADTPQFDLSALLDEPDEPLLEAPEPQERIEASYPDPIDFAAAQAVNEEVETAAIEAEPLPEPTPEPVQEIAEPVAEEPVGPTSITQQYKEQPSSTQESGAIYDTESYHQPVAKPVKKKASWLIILWIILLVAVGAGVGWATYVYILPML